MIKTKGWAGAGGTYTVYPIIATPINVSNFVLIVKLMKDDYSN